MICTNCKGEICPETVPLKFGDIALGEHSDSIVCAHICKGCGKAYYSNGEPVVVVQQSEVFRKGGITTFVDKGSKYPVFVPISNAADTSK